MAHNMLIFAFSLFLMTASFAQGSFPGNITTIEPDEIVSLLTSRFKNYKTFSSRFNESFRGRTRRGRVKFKKPHFLKVVYLKDDGTTNMEIVANKEKLFVYLKEINIVCEQDLVEMKSDTFFEMKTVNLDKLINNYNFNFLESKHPLRVLNEKDHERFGLVIENRQMAYHFKLTPKNKTSGLNRMELWIGTNGLIRRSRSVTIEGRALDLFFYDIKIDTVLSDREFFFEVPAQARVIRNSLMEYGK